MLTDKDKEDDYHFESYGYVDRDDITKHLLGKTLGAIVKTDEELILFTTTMEKYKLLHQQD